MIFPSTICVCKQTNLCRVLCMNFKCQTIFYLIQFSSVVSFPLSSHNYSVLYIIVFYPFSLGHCIVCTFKLFHFYSFHFLASDFTILSDYQDDQLHLWLHESVSQNNINVQNMSLGSPNLIKIESRTCSLFSIGCILVATWEIQHAPLGITSVVNLNKRSLHMTLEIQDWDRHKNVTGLHSYHE